MFHYAQKLEEFSGLITEIAEGSGDSVAASQSQEANRCVAKRG